jgi:CRISPR/Cas system endoribonuclease Cas6 (RAMP superfamily)
MVVSFSVFLLTSARHSAKEVKQGSLCLLLVAGPRLSIVQQLRNRLLQLGQVREQAVAMHCLDQPISPSLNAVWG